MKCFTESVALVLFVLTVVGVAHAKDDPVPRTEWAHLDCSSCLAVAAVLGERMNRSLSDAPGSYLVSHRLERESSERRIAYKRGELRGVEVLDNMCGDKAFQRFFLRLNPKSKVRGYHVLNHGVCKKGYRDALLERDSFPDKKSVGSWFWSKLDGITIPVAHFYNKYEHVKMGNAGFHKAAQVACANFLDGHDEELTELVRELDWLSEVEEQLCGLDWGHVVSTTRRQISDLPEKKTTVKDEGEPWKGLSAPLSSVCVDRKGVQASARIDQKRWFAWSFKRKQKREALRAEKEAPRQAVPPVEAKPSTENAGTEDGEAGDL